MKNLVKAAIAASFVGLLAAGSAHAATWEELLAAGRKEGTLTVIGPVSPEARKLLTEAFPKETGIQLSYEGLEPQVVPPRIEREAAASSLTVDVLIGGSAELNSLLPKGLLAPIKPILILPEVTDASKW
jgi:spermidine/putrescine-binding protein